MDWGLLLHCAALTFTLARALRSGECRGDGGSEPGGRLRGCGSGGRAVGPLRATSPPGTFRWGTGAVRSSPGTSGPGIAFWALWGARTEQVARSHKIRIDSYLNSVSSHRQLNKSRLRYLKDNERWRRKALPRPFFPQSERCRSALPVSGCPCTCGCHSTQPTPFRGAQFVYNSRSARGGGERGGLSRPTKAQILF